MFYNKEYIYVDELERYSSSRLHELLVKADQQWTDVLARYDIARTSMKAYLEEILLGLFQIRVSIEAELRMRTQLC